MKTASWVLLALVGALTLLGSLASAFTAYGGTEDRIQPDGPTVQELEAVHPGLADALRGRRATAAAFAVAYAVLFLYVTLVPYRRGDIWSWWALLASSLALAIVVLARVPVLGTRAGAGTGLAQLVVVVVALLLDLRRLRPAPAGIPGTYQV
jgi:hypothetical protein